MVRDIIAEVYPWESRVAIVEEGRLVEVFWADQEENVGNVYKGRVKDVIPGLSCAFIDIGLAKNAFLYSGDIARVSASKGANIADVLKTGQDVMVQVKKEAFAEKGARVTGDLTIPGHFLVLLPFQNEVSISRKIVGDERRNHLRSLIEKNKSDRVGIILRTACLDAEDGEIMGELHRLMDIWKDIKNRYDKMKATQMIYEDVDVVERALRDYLDGDIRRIIVNNLKMKNKIDLLIADQDAIYSTRVQFAEGDLFEKYGLEKDIRKALRRKVWLKSGGYLIFDATEAMTVIDVNSGKFTGKKDFEDTVHRLNLEAAVEIPRQLRLRSLGGIILIDFIDMKDKQNEADVIAVLRKELEKDKAHSRIIGMTGLGFLEMTRKKSRYGITQVFTDECRNCHGRGHTINILSLACQVKRKLANMGYLESDEIICELNPRLLEFITDDDRNLGYIQKVTGKKIRMVPNESLNLADYNISSG
ncbi:MAG: ribonuclease E/G [Firmicutes bacterium HGW-Firmicutes-15]|nr:MAG: ribonuclease E/G [Firmicutes bacterium HGW-Firmicutes-15]